MKVVQVLLPWETAFLQMANLLPNIGPTDVSPKNYLLALKPSDVLYMTFFFQTYTIRDILSNFIMAVNGGRDFEAKIKFIHPS